MKLVKGPRAGRRGTSVPGSPTGSNHVCDCQFAMACSAKLLPMLSPLLDTRHQMLCSCMHGHAKVASHINFHIAGDDSFLQASCRLFIRMRGPRSWWASQMLGSSALGMLSMHEPSIMDVSICQAHMCNLEHSSNAPTLACEKRHPHSAMQGCSSRLKWTYPETHQS